MNRSILYMLFLMLIFNLSGNIQSIDSLLLGRVSLPDSSITVPFQTNFTSFEPAISSTGRYVAFTSNASNFVAGDTNAVTDVFMRDRDTDNDTIFDEPDAVSITLISVSNGGGAANGFSDQPAISPDGRYVAFRSAASNLVGGDSNGTTDIFVRDTQLNSTIRVSVGTGGVQGNNNSASPSISSDGHYVAFESVSTNLVALDTNGQTDVFVHDTQLNNTIRASVDIIGVQATGGASTNATISADGNYVAFQSAANNLVGMDSNMAEDVFVRDIGGNNIIRVSVDSGGTQGNGHSTTAKISGDGQFVAFRSVATNLVANDTNSTDDIFVRDIGGNSTLRASVDNGGGQVNNQSITPSISADGRYVAFRSSASTLVAGDTNGVPDIFVRDTVGNSTTRVNVDSTGTQSNGFSQSTPISANGRYVAFESVATNLVTDDTNGVSDIFVRDTTAPETVRVSLPVTSVNQAMAASSNPRVSDDGRYVVFESIAANLVMNDTNSQSDIFVRDTVLDTTTRVSVSTAGVQGNNASYSPWISGDGQYVMFLSAANNLVGGDSNGVSDVFVRDTVGNTTIRVNVDDGGIQANNATTSAAMSRDGGYIVFRTLASNLVANDLNGVDDIFVRDRVGNTTTRVSVDDGGTEADGSSGDQPFISDDGQYVVFSSLATNLVASDTNGKSDIFVRDRVGNTTIRVSVDDGGIEAKTMVVMSPTTRLPATSSPETLTALMMFLCVIRWAIPPSAPAWTAQALRRITPVTLLQSAPMVVM